VQFFFINFVFMIFFIMSSFYFPKEKHVELWPREGEAFFLLCLVDHLFTCCTKFYFVLLGFEA
jgi:hypothetical protein